MTLRFSEPVRASTTAGLAVLGMTVKPAAQVNGAHVALSLVEGTARGDALPGAWVDGPGVTDLAGNAALRGSVTPTDEAPPVMLAAATQDTGGAKGHIDAVAVTFSEPVAHPRDAGGNYPFLLSSHTVTSVEPANGTSVQVRIAEADSPDTGARPTVRYLAGPGFPVVDGAGNQVADGSLGSADEVAPALMSATTADDDDDGRIDRAVLRFSENVEHAAESGQQSSFAVAGYQVTGAGAASGSDVSLGLVEGGGPDSGATPAVTYNRDGVEDVRDAAANLTLNSSVSESTDGARPVLLSAQTGDVDGDGRIDRVASTWSEPLVHADDTSAPFAVSASGFTVARVRAADGEDLAIDLTEPAGFDTGSKPNLTYLGDDAKIRDAAGLEPEEQTWAGLTVDALNPRLVSATTGDTDVRRRARLDRRALLGAGRARAGGRARLVHGGRLHDPQRRGGRGRQRRAEAPAVGQRRHGSPARGRLHAGRAERRARPGRQLRPDRIDRAGDRRRAARAAHGATADVNDNGKLDRVTTSWSEPLVHADDSTAPFPVTVRAAQRRPRPRRGGAGARRGPGRAGRARHGLCARPDLHGRCRPDPRRGRPRARPDRVLGRTRDALPPRRVSTITVDGDLDGKLDAIDIEWSERVTGATGTAPYTVAGRTLGANVSFGTSTTRVPFVEDPGQFDTDATPDVSYDAGPGDLHDEAEGVGDTTADAPSVATETPLDKAAPILVAAKTADLTTPSVGNVPNGTIDAVLATFSEPISHSPDAFGPFSLNVAGRSEVDVEGDAGAGDRTLYVRVAEAASPDGGLTPNVSVQAVGPVADHIQ